MSHTETVQQIYAAFLRQDVAAILDCLSEDIEWEYGEVSPGVPWIQPRRGKQQVAQFFQDLTALDFTKFEPTIFLERDDLVVTLIDLEAVVRSTGKRFVELDEVHLFRFDAAGNVCRFRHRADTHLQWLALQK